MILVDANLLILRSTPICHTMRRGGPGWTSSLGVSDRRAAVGHFARLSAYLHQRAHLPQQPLSIAEAIDYVDQWLALPTARALGPGPHHWRILRELEAANGTGGNLTTEAHVAALAIEQGCSVCSADNDFKRFAGIRHINPLAS